MRNSSISLVILSGSVRVVGHDGAGQELLLASLGPGAFFGEIALLRDVPRTATVVAPGSLRTATLDRGEFLAALSVNGESATAADAITRGRIEAGAWSGPATVGAGPEPTANHDDVSAYPSDTEQDRNLPTSPPG